MGNTEVEEAGVGTSTVDMAALASAITEGTATDLLKLIPPDKLHEFLERFNVPPAVATAILGRVQPHDPQDVVDAEPEGDQQVPNSRDNSDFLNFAGSSLGSMIEQVPGLCLGITFEPGPRGVRCRASTYLVDGEEVHKIVGKRASAARLGDLLAAVMSETEDAIAQGDQVEDDDDVGDDD